MERNHNLSFTSIRIIFLGAYNTKKTVLVNKFKEYLHKNSEIQEIKNLLPYVKTEETQIHKVYIDNINMDEVSCLEIFDTPGTDYWEVIGNIKDENVNTTKSFTLENQKKFFESQASQYIQEFLTDLLFSSSAECFDIYVITYDITKMWTMEEALLYLRLIHEKGLTIVVGINCKDKSEPFQEKYFKEYNVKAFCYLNKGNVSNNNDFFKILLEQIKCSINSAENNEEILEKYYNLYIQNSIENNYKTLEEYKKEFKEYLVKTSSSNFDEFNSYEKLSFNDYCISDESLLILQSLTIKGEEINIELNRYLCHICEKKDNPIPKIILSSCFHCYCHDCMEILCKKVTNNSMRRVSYLTNISEAKCGVEKCNKTISLKDAEKCGKMFGNI